MNDNKSRDIFYGVVAIATLIVALVGATLAYFSLTAGSEEGAVSATAAIVSIEYKDGQQVSAQANKLIPASFDVVKSIYERNSSNFVLEDNPDDNICTDDSGSEIEPGQYEPGRQICSIYRFTVKSDVQNNFTATLNTEENSFTYLSYAVHHYYMDSNNELQSEWIKLDGTDEDKNLIQCVDNEDDPNACYTTVDGTKVYKTTPRTINSIFGYVNNNLKTQTIGNKEHTYDIVIFIKENEANQNIDQGKTYKGTIKIETITTNGDNDGQIKGIYNATRH